MLWRDKVIGWANLAVRAGELVADLGYADGAPRDTAYTSALEVELDAMRQFLGLDA